MACIFDPCSLSHTTRLRTLWGGVRKGLCRSVPGIDFLQASRIASLLPERVYAPGQTSVWQTLHVSRTYLYLAPPKITVLLATVDAVALVLGELRALIIARARSHRLARPLPASPPWH